MWGDTIVLSINPPDVESKFVLPPGKLSFELVKIEAGVRITWATTNYHRNGFHD